MRRHNAIVLLTIATWFCATAWGHAHHHRHLLQDIVAPDAVAAVPGPAATTFTAADFAPTFPEAAAALEGVTEVTIVYGQPSVQSASAPQEVSEAELRTIEAQVAAAGPPVRYVVQSRRAPVVPDHAAAGGTPTHPLHLQCAGGGTGLATTTRVVWSTCSVSLVLQVTAAAPPAGV